MGRTVGHHSSFHDDTRRGRRRARTGLRSAIVAALLASAFASPALAQEASGAEEYCAASAAYQYGCNEPRGCAPQQQYPGSGGCAPDQYGYDVCAGDEPCSAAQAQNELLAPPPLPPASVQNAVVAAANSASADAPEASRALDATRPAESGGNTALAAEEEPVSEEPPSAAPPAENASAAAAGGPSAAPASPEPRTTAPPEKTVRVAQSAETFEEERPQVTQEGEGTLLDQLMVPLIALGGSTLLICGGLLTRRIVG